LRQQGSLSVSPRQTHSQRCRWPREIEVEQCALSKWVTRCSLEGLVPLLRSQGMSWLLAEAARGQWRAWSCSLRSAGALQCWLDHHRVLWTQYCFAHHPVFAAAGPAGPTGSSLSTHNAQNSTNRSTLRLAARCQRDNVTCRPALLERPSCADRDACLVKLLTASSMERVPWCPTLMGRPWLGCAC
jgi:hypothetical protein